MFISASRRTDIPSHYSEWFMNRIRAGFVLVRNPVNPRQVSRVSLSPDVVDGIVFWTKNPIPMLDRLDGLSGYMYCFQFTLNAYGAEVERGIPSKNAQLVDAFRRLSDKIGPERVLWRYDPIFVSSKYTVEYHLKYFEALARRLAGYTGQCTMSFLDVYGNTARNMAPLHARTPSEQERAVLAAGLAEIAAGYGLRLRSCAEPDSLRRYGIEPASCVDARLFEKLLGCRLDAGRDATQRPYCGCAGSVDCQKRLSTAFFDNKVPRRRRKLRVPIGSGNPRSAYCTSWERRSSGMTELPASAGSEGYAACDDDGTLSVFAFHILAVSMSLLTGV